MTGGPLAPGERHALGGMAARDRGGDEELRRRLGIAPSRRAGGTAAYLDAVLARAPGAGHEDAAAARAAAGDARAREALVEAALPRIVARARRLTGPGAPFGDLVQEGVLGVLEALSRYAPERGTPFWAYATPWVDGAMRRLARDGRRAVRLPPRALADLAALKDAAAALRAEGRDAAALAAVAARAGMSPERAGALARAEAPPRSLDAPLDEAEGVALADVLPDPSATEAYDRVVEEASTPALAMLLGALGEREREVLERRYGLGGREAESLGAVGRRLGISRERVRQLEARALDKLRAA